MTDEEDDHKPARNKPEPKQDGPEDRAGLLVDFGPLLVFVLAYRIGGIYWATGSFMVTAPAALLIHWLRQRRIRVMPLITAVVVLVFGGMTIWFGDPRFIYVKPTIVSSLIGLTLLGGLAFNRALLKPVLDSALELNEEGWRALSLRFGVFSLGLAALNEVMWRTLTPESESLWVWFKFLGIPGLTMLFLLAQGPLIKRCSLTPPDADGEPGK